MVANPAPSVTALEAADALLVDAEKQAMQAERGFIKYAGGYFLKVRIDGDGFTYRTSLGHSYADRDAALQDIAACYLERHIVGCCVCKRVRPADDYRAALCHECTESLRAAGASEAAREDALWGRLHRAAARGDL